MRRKTDLQLDEREMQADLYHLWSRKLPGTLAKQVFLVTTISENGLPNVAPKSWTTPCHGGMFLFCCSKEHHTCQNIARTGEFVVNYPGVDLEEKIWSLNVDHAAGEDELARVGLTALPASVVKPPRVAECRVHLECVLERTVDPDPENFFVIIIGRVVAASADADLLEEQQGRLVFGAKRGYLYLG